MGDRELVKIAAFKLEESAKRMTALAGEADSVDVRTRLLWLSRQLQQHARALGGREAPRAAVRVG